MANPDELLKQKPLFDQYLKAVPHELAVFHFSSVFLWQNFFEFEFETIEDSLCVFAHQAKSCFLYLPPLGKELKSTVIELCFAKMNAVNPRTARIENIEAGAVGFFKGPYRDYAKSQDYVYRTLDLIELKGHAYKSQRHDIHHYETRHPSVFRPYKDQDKEQCLALYKQWMEHRYQKHEDEIYRQMLVENKIVHELALGFHAQLGLSGFVVESDQKIEAYSFGYSLNSNTFCVLLEVTHPQRIGLSAYIFNRVCADHVVRSHEFINTMDDFGLPYVAASKQAYHPVLKPVSYTVTHT